MEEDEATLLLTADLSMRFDTGGGLGKFGIGPGWEARRGDLRCAKDRIGDGGDVQLPRILLPSSEPARSRFDSECRFEEPACEYIEAVENVENGRVRVGKEIDVLVRLGGTSKLERVGEGSKMPAAT